MKTHTYGNKSAKIVLIQPIDGRELAAMEKEVKEIKRLSNKDFCLVALEVDDWNKDLSPWKAPAVFGKEDFGGGAEATLKEVLDLCKDNSKEYICGGYSLGALFSLWVACKTGSFVGVAAASPSVWYPGFLDYMKKEEIKTGRVYLSLGDKEAKTKNRIMSTVADCMEEARRVLDSRGVETIFEWNPGNHFKDPEERTAKAFAKVINGLGNKAGKTGRVEWFTYDGIAERKKACVYLPYDYDDTQRYDILYLMHGGGGGPEDYFGSMDHETRFKKRIDTLIEEGKIQPLIIVTPTVYSSKYDKKDKVESWEAAKEFLKEIDTCLMPAVESVYSTYAENVNEEGFIASRKHRAFGGFSLGSVTTWYMVCEKLRFFSKFIPISGDCWILGRKCGGHNPTETAAALVDVVRAQGYSGKDYRIYALTGSKDRAAEGLGHMMDALKEYPEYFDMSREGNTSFTVFEDGEHEMKWVKKYLGEVLPKIY